MSRAPVLSRKQLEEIANAHIRSFIRFDGKDDPKFSAWKFAVHYLGKKVRFEWLSNEGVYLGLSVFSDHTPVPVYIPETGKVSLQEVGKDTILLDKTLAAISPDSSSRPRFTLMHECAHQILHRDYFLRQNLEGNSCGIAYSLQKREDVPGDAAKPKREWTDEDWLEWQANYLAGALLMPSHRVRRFLEESILISEYRDRVRTKQPEEAAYRYLVRGLAGAFRVSPVTAGIRLDQIGFTRLPDQAMRKPCIYNLPHTLAPVRKTERERRNEETLADWEDRRLDPEYIFPGIIYKSVNKKRRIRRAGEKA